MSEAYILSAVRTPVGIGKPGGKFSHINPVDFGALVLAAAVERAGIEAELIDDVIWGCVNQTLEQGFNIARNASLLAELPHSVSAQTVNRLCGSSMSALHIAAQSIVSGYGDIFVVGGVEHMGHVPMDHGIDINPGLSKHAAKAAMMMGVTAELLGKMNGINRQMQDEFGVRSHQKAHQAALDGHWDKEIIPVEGSIEAI